jgi:hypothetical protein
MTPFAGAHYLLGVSYCSRLEEALSERISDKGSRRGVVSANPAMEHSREGCWLPLLESESEIP